jgi:hypothetical protein
MSLRTPSARPSAHTYPPPVFLSIENVTDGGAGLMMRCLFRSLSSMAWTCFQKAVSSLANGKGESRPPSPSGSGHPFNAVFLPWWGMASCSAVSGGVIPPTASPATPASRNPPMSKRKRSDERTWTIVQASGPTYCSYLALKSDTFGQEMDEASRRFHFTRVVGELQTSSPSPSGAVLHFLASHPDMELPF